MYMRFCLWCNPHAIPHAVIEGAWRRRPCWPCMTLHTEPPAILTEGACCPETLLWSPFHSSKNINTSCSVHHVPNAQWRKWKKSFTPFHHAKLHWDSPYCDCDQIMDASWHCCMKNAQRYEKEKQVFWSINGLSTGTNMEIFEILKP